MIEDRYKKMTRQNESILEKVARIGVFAGVAITIAPEAMIYLGYQFKNPIDAFYIAGVGTLIGLASATTFAVSGNRNYQIINS